MPLAPLEFSLLEERVHAYVIASDDPKPGALERWSFAIGLFAGGAASLAGVIINGTTGLHIVLLGLALELLGLGIGVICWIRREWRTFSRRHRYQTFARELDHAFVEYQGIVDWLRDYPRAERAKRLRYLRDRKATLTYRSGLFTGGMERLGFLPILAVLYLQFKDWEFGDWQALGHLHLLGGLLLWMLLLAYFGSWWLTGLKSRIDLYEALLAEATADDMQSGRAA